MLRGDNWEGNDADNPVEDKFRQGTEESKVRQLGKNSLGGGERGDVFFPPFVVGCYPFVRGKL